MAIGFGLALAIIATAVFLDQVLGAARAIGGGVRQMAVPVGRAALRSLRRTGRVARGAGAAGAGLAAAFRSFRGVGAARSRPPARERVADELLTVPSSAQPSEPEERARPPRTSEPTQSEPIYTPASTIHIEAAVRVFLESRGGGASMDQLVRHLDRTFGKGIGVGLVESLRGRGVLRLTRRPETPTRLDVKLNDPSIPQSEA